MRIKEIFHRYPCATAGERLYIFIRSELISARAWFDLQDVLEFTGRHTELVDLFQQVAAVHLTGRLVVAGASFAEIHDMSDLQFRQNYTEFIRDTTGETGERSGKLYRLAEAAVRACRRAPSHGQLRNFEAWAQRRHPRCFMCDVALDFAVQGTRASFTCEHIWPRMYGGDSIEENFLPSCYDCNCRIKKDLASWAAVGVQSLILGIRPSARSLESIDNVYNFALHYRAAQRYASKNNASLKEAFLQVGPWTSVRVWRPDDVADFFNLANHDPDLDLT
jgi:hypothetical protein